MRTAVPASHLGKLVDGRYRLQRVVGEGASSWVFAATDERLEREVALKLFKPPSSDDDLKRRRRCIAEGRTLAKLLHPHIVAIHDASEDGSGQTYLVMELCEAGTLEAELAQRGPLELVETLQLLLPLMGALAFAHDRDIVHRDIKPGNIVLMEDRNERRCKLLDFGISLGAGVQTSSDLALGTPAYMAPEQVRGEPTRPATDVWALGVVLFRCLAGKLPFDASNSAGILLQVVHGRAPRFSTVCNPQLAPRVLLALDRSLEPDSERRYRDMRGFARALAVACALDGVPVMRRPEPIGLPEFDAWLLAAKACPTTRPLPVTAWELTVRKARGLPWVGGVALAAVVTALIGGVALALSTATDRASPADLTPAKARRIPASAGADASGPSLAKGPRAPESIPSAQIETTAPLTPESELKGATTVRIKNLKPRRAAAKRTRAGGSAAPPPAPRVIMSWDW